MRNWNFLYRYFWMSNRLNQQLRQRFRSILFPTGEVFQQSIDHRDRRNNENIANPPLRQRLDVLRPVSNRTYKANKSD
jgi:hypothetical protein